MLSTKDGTDSYLLLVGKQLVLCWHMEKVGVHTIEQRFLSLSLVALCQNSDTFLLEVAL